MMPRKPKVHATSRGVGDFFRSLVSVQQENGRIILYCIILTAIDVGLIAAILTIPKPDDYLVDGVVQQHLVDQYWGNDHADIDRLTAQ